MIELLYKWQTLTGAIIAFIAPFLLWSFSYYYNKRVRYYNHLDYLERELLAQIYILTSIRDDIRSFIDTKISKIIIHTTEKTGEQYSIDNGFFPLFACPSMNNDINKISINIPYIDSKLSHVFLLSKNMPFIVDDMRKQFYSIMTLNKEIAFNKFYEATVQRNSYIFNLRRYIEVLENDMLRVNIPNALRAVVETKTALSELKRIHLTGWFFKVKLICYYRAVENKFSQTKKESYDITKEYFEASVDKQLLKIDEILNSDSK